MKDTSITGTGEPLAPERIIQDLRRPEAYSHDVQDVGFLQTHISWLFFAQERVYKVKKAVDLGFLDFTALERRHHFCEEEVRLNRRLAPRVYLGVVPITVGPDGHLRVGGDGEVVEWAVEMERLPEQRMFSNLLDRGEIDNRQMNSMVSLLAGFHADTPTGDGVDEYGSPDAVTANVEENFEQLLDFMGIPGDGAARPVQVISPNQHAFLQAQARGYLTTHHDLLQRRLTEHRIREGHGDLHAGNINLGSDGIVAYDCIEFGRRFRCGDVASELAFLAMDLDHRGYPGFSGYLMKRYAEATDDEDLLELGAFYKGYRAVVRGKVTAMAANDPDLDDIRRQDLRAEAMRYIQLATAYELPPTMVLMCGLPACGKSWLAKHLARSMRGAVLRSDVRRKWLSGVAVSTHAHDEYGAGLYSPALKDRTYRSLLSDTLDKLLGGQSVIVDATFSKRAHRAVFVDAAARLELPYCIVHVTTSEETIRERLERRKSDPGEASDADLAVYLRERASFEPPTEVPTGHLVETISGDGIPEDQCSAVIDRMIALVQEKGRST